MPAQIEPLPQQITHYRNLLAFHDWFYQYSDDHSCYKEGARQRSMLWHYKAALDPYNEIWNEFAPKEFQLKVVLHPVQEPKP